MNYLFLTITNIFPGGGPINDKDPVVTENDIRLFVIALLVLLIVIPFVVGIVKSHIKK